MPQICVVPPRTCAVSLLAPSVRMKGSQEDGVRVMIKRGEEKERGWKRDVCACAERE